MHLKIKFFYMLMPLVLMSNLGFSQLTKGVKAVDSMHNEFLNLQSKQL